MGKGSCRAVLALLTFLPMGAFASSNAFTVHAGAPTCAAGGAAVVIGQNNPAIDLPAVQAAVDGNLNVTLQGTFDFGDGGRVLLLCDVGISGQGGATIRNGEWDFYTPKPSTSPVVAGPKVSIANIDFVQARGTAIHLVYSGGASISHNVIEDMRSRVVSASPPVSERAAIVVGPNLVGPINAFIPNLVSGDIDVSDNVIDVLPPEPTVTRATGMFVSMYIGADVRIERNTVTGNTRTGLAILDGEADAGGRGSVLIAHNTIRSSVPVGFNRNLGPRAPIGIVTGFNNIAGPGTDPTVSMIPVLIQDNTIELGDPTYTGANATSPMGLIDIWNGAVIADNVITVHGHSVSTTKRTDTSGGILATTSHQVLFHNTVGGEGCNAIRIGGTLDGQERLDNVGKANNVLAFQAFTGGYVKCADVWLEPASHDNVMVGNSGTVIDDGVDNKVTGFAPVKGGVGAEVSEASQDVAQAEGMGFD
jgi:hypothetical protein